MTCSILELQFFIQQHTYTMLLFFQTIIRSTIPITLFTEGNFPKPLPMPTNDFHRMSVRGITCRPESTWPIYPTRRLDRKSTRLNSSHLGISYAVFCLKK